MIDAPGMNIRATLRSIRVGVSFVDTGDSISDIVSGRGRSDLWNPNNFHGFGLTQDSADVQLVRTYRRGSTVKSTLSGVISSPKEGTSESPAGESIQSEVVMVD